LTVFVLFSCEKKDELNPGPEFVSFDFGIVGELFPSLKNQNTRTIQVIMPQESSFTDLRTYLNLPEETKAYLNDTPLNTGETLISYANPVVLGLRPQGSVMLQKWTIHVGRESQVYGLGFKQDHAKSVNIDRNFYADQFNTGKYSSNNCGPAVAAMASRWADSTFSQSVDDLRNSLKPDGSPWSTSDMMSHLQSRSIHASIVYLGEIEGLVKKQIDEGRALILCLDMYYVQQNTDRIQKRGKFYSNRSRGKGHFILVKGYRVVDQVFYLEVYDPNAAGRTYLLNGEPLGKDRYYAAQEIKQATENWWKYAIVLYPKN
jgi:hypothetical protein